MTNERDAVSATEIADRTEQMLMGVFGEAHPGTVFSAPHIHGDELIVTAAAWERAGGFGFGEGSGGDAHGSGGGGGGGGGGTSQGRPVAVIRIGPGGLEVRPVIDFTRIGVTVLLTALGMWRILRH